MASDDLTLATYKFAKTPPGVPAPTFAAASVSGILKHSKGCLMLARADGNDVELVFYEGDARYSDGSVVTNNASFKIGDRVELGGRGRANEMIVSASSVRCPDVSRWYVAPGTMAVIK